MSFKNSILSQILQEVKRHDFKKQVSKYEADKNVSKLKCFSLLVVLLFAQIRRKGSIRDIIIDLKIFESDLYHLNLKEIKRSTLSDSMKNRDYRVFEDFYYDLLQGLNRPQKRKFKRKVNIMDASTISLCIQKYNWAKFRTTKGGIKLNTTIDYDTGLPEEVIITNAGVHEINTAKKQKYNENEIYVKDRGYVDYGFLYGIKLSKAFFVTRIKKNTKYKVIEEKSIHENTGIISDQIIKITGMKKDDYPENLRLVTFYHAETKKSYKFVTNYMEVKPEEIADLYKIRWQIELFFKWIKQNLKIKTFISTSENGVKMQIWVALLTFLMLWIIKNRLHKKMTMLEITRLIRSGLEKRCDLYEFLTQENVPKTIKKSKKSDQLELKYA